MAMKYWPSIWPTSKIWTMFGWDSVAAMRASARSISMNARSWFIDGRIRLMTSSFSNPATLFWMARNSSAIPPVASLRMSVYLPKRLGMPSMPNDSPFCANAVARAVSAACAAGTDGSTGELAGAIPIPDAAPIPVTEMRARERGSDGGEDGAWDILRKP
jgi:hypothetical protein